MRNLQEVVRSPATGEESPLPHTKATASFPCPSSSQDPKFVHKQPHKPASATPQNHRVVSRPASAQPLCGAPTCVWRGGQANGSLATTATGNVQKGGVRRSLVSIFHLPITEFGTCHRNIRLGGYGAKYEHSEWMWWELEL